MMAATPSPPPPPPPPPPPLGPTPPVGLHRAPVPGHAALPYFPSPPVQETSPPPEAVHENGTGMTSASEESGTDVEPHFPSPSAGDIVSHCGDAPVQETGPAAQVMELQEAANKQWEPPADGKQP